MADLDELKRDLDTFKSDVKTQFKGVREDLKELTHALRELIRMDGDIKRQQDAIARIGEQVDEHEKRLRSIETTGAVNTTRVGTTERVIWILVTAGVGALSFLLTH